MRPTLRKWTNGSNELWLFITDKGAIKIRDTSGNHALTVTMHEGMKDISDANWQELSADELDELELPVTFLNHEAFMLILAQSVPDHNFKLKTLRIRHKRLEENIDEQKLELRELEAQIGRLDTTKTPEPVQSMIDLD